MSDAGAMQWPRFVALCETCKPYGRHVELHVGELEKDSSGNMVRKLTTLSIGIGERRLLSQRILKGNLDKAAELIERQLGMA